MARVKHIAPSLKVKESSTPLCEASPDVDDPGPQTSKPPQPDKSPFRLRNLPSQSATTPARRDRPVALPVSDARSELRCVRMYKLPDPPKYGKDENAFTRLRDRRPWFEGTQFDDTKWSKGCYQVPEMFAECTPHYERSVSPIFTPPPAPPREPEPIPDDVAEIAAYIEGMPISSRKRGSGRQGFPSKHALRTDERLKGEISKKDGCFASKSKLRLWMGDERLLSKEMWLYLTVAGSPEKEVARDGVDKEGRGEEDLVDKIVRGIIDAR